MLLLGHALTTLLDDRTHRCLCSAGLGPAGGTADQECAARGYFADGRQMLCGSAAGLRGPTPRSTIHSTRERVTPRPPRMRDRSQNRGRAPARPHFVDRALRLGLTSSPAKSCGTSRALAASIRRARRRRGETPACGNSQLREAAPGPGPVQARAASGPAEAGAAPGPVQAASAPGPVQAASAPGPAEAGAAPGPAEAGAAPGPVQAGAAPGPVQAAAIDCDLWTPFPRGRCSKGHSGPARGLGARSANPEMPPPGTPAPRCRPRDAARGNAVLRDAGPRCRPRDAALRDTTRADAALGGAAGADAAVAVSPGTGPGPIRGRPRAGRPARPGPGRLRDRSQGTSHAPPPDGRRHR